MFIDTLGGRLKFAMTVTKTTGGSLAKKAGLSQSYVSQVSTGKVTALTLESVDSLSKALGVKPAWLAYGVGESGLGFEVVKVEEEK